MHAPISVPCLATLAAYLQRSLALNSPTLPCDSQSQRNTHLAVIYHRSDLELTHLALPILADHALQHSPCTYPSPCLALQHSLCTTHHQHVTYLMCLPTHSLCHMIIAPPAQHITYSLCRSPSLARGYNDNTPPPWPALLRKAALQRSPQSPCTHSPSDHSLTLPSHTHFDAALTSLTLHPLVLPRNTHTP